MTISAPMEVRLRTDIQERCLTNEAQGLSYRLSAPGGMQSASVTVPRRLLFDTIETEHYATLVVHDRRTAEILFEGRVEDLGRAATADGEWRELTAVGTAGHASDQERPYHVLDKTLDNWEPAGNFAPYIKLERSADPDTEKDCLMFSLPQGVNTAVNDRLSAQYRALEQAGQLFGGISYTIDSGGTSTARELHFRYPSGTLIQSDTQSTSPVSRGLEVSTNFGVGNVNNTPWLRMHIAAASTPTTAGNIWTSVYDIVVKALRKNADGTDILTGPSYVPDTVRAHDIVNDLLGRMLPEYDGANAVVSTAATHDIDQMLYLEPGIQPVEVFNDIMALEPTFAWYAWENGRYEWNPWPTTPRYQILDVIDDIQAPSSVAEVYDEVQVHWKGANGFNRYTQVTAAGAGIDVPVLTKHGLNRCKSIELAAEIGSSSNATRVGTQFLVEHATPPNTATLTVARPLLDRFRGMILPQQIRPGELIRVPGILPSVDALNASARNGVSVFKIINVDVGEDGVARLELDSNPRTTTRALARMARRRRR